MLFRSYTTRYYTLRTLFKVIALSVLWNDNQENKSDVWSATNTNVRVNAYLFSLYACAQVGCQQFDHHNEDCRWFNHILGPAWKLRKEMETMVA